MSTISPAGVGAPGRATINAKTLREDRWWLQPLITFTVLVLFIIYSTIRAFMGQDFYKDPYISPFYSPCLSTEGCGDAPSIGLFPSNAASCRFVDGQHRREDPPRRAGADIGPPQLLGERTHPGPQRCRRSSGSSRWAPSR